jgi:hypothetical protein
MGFNTYVLRVLQYDFTMDGGKYVPTTREIEYLYSPFTVLAYDTIDAMNKVSDRVGWCISECEFLEGGEDESL